MYHVYERCEYPDAAMKRPPYKGVEEKGLAAFFQLERCVVELRSCNQQHANNVRKRFVKPPNATNVHAVADERQSDRVASVYFSQSLPPT